MDAFIPTVVMEEEKRRHIQESDPNTDEPAEWEVMDVDEASNSAITNNRNLQLGRSSALGSDQRHSRTLHLDAVTPRLEILENMPFFIPFATRVKIFREFIALDKERRRGQFVDPDSWRFSILNDPRGHGNEELRRRHARIRREHVFEDAYDELYTLGDGLKEPIQITFVDKFDQVEAGIDGGGVTKEFLTSITKEAFSASGGLRMFVENDKHLLYPNPSALEERKQLLRDLGIAENSTVWLEHMRAVLRRYEFLGRIIGKCMYEGILVDVGFVGFFLLKWALTGGTGSASTESGYRANLNDLRDLDESLYQGLVSNPR
jgi:ubiquitin-protein ligase E3 C